MKSNHIGTASITERAASLPHTGPNTTANDLGYCLDAPHYIPAGSVRGTEVFGMHSRAWACERTVTKDVPWALR